MERTAQCSCGHLSVTVEGDPELVVLCNCEQCQRRTGSLFGVAAYFGKDKVTVVSGKPKTFVRGSESGRKLSMHFCPDCGSTLYWDLEMLPEQVGVAVGCFADPDFPPPQRSVWCRTKHRWFEFPPSFTLYPEAPQ